jgi:D-inositol-3-phosphate glycosyltransferase
MAVVFFPRGGSAQVIRYVARSLPDAGWSVKLLAGSFGGPEKESNAERF